METLSDYTIYCTEEQTKKALGLGAPIYVYDEINSKSIDELDVYLDDKAKLNNGLYAEIPTAEQMIGWLRTKGFAFGITEYKDGFNDHVFWRVANNQDKRWYISDDKFKDPKEAFLAAIDAALEYLSNKK